MKKLFLGLFAALFLASCGSNKTTVNGENVELQPGIYAKIATTQGDILFQFYTENAPMTSANFIALAEGNHPQVSEKYAGKPYFDGLIFHRVIPRFMIQGGDPEGKGTGGPGYQFPQEIHEDLRHDTAGIVAMANSGPNTNGSQFYITHNATPQLDGSYNVFGKVVEGQDVVKAIGDVDRSRNDKPKTDVVMEKVEIIRVGKEAKAWDAPQHFTEGVEAWQAAQEEIQARKEQLMQELYDAIDAAYPEAQKTASGLRYIITEKGNGPKPEIGQFLEVNYTGYLMDGTMFDSSVEEDAKRGGVFNPQRPYEPFPVVCGPQGRVIEGWREGLQLLNVGDKAKLIIPPHLGYGDRAMGPRLPANSVLVFDVQIMGIK